MGTDENGFKLWNRAFIFCVVNNLFLFTSIFFSKILCTLSSNDLVGFLAHITINLTSVSPLSSKPLANSPTRITPFNALKFSSLISLLLKNQ